MITNSISFLDTIVRVTIDRKLGSKHPNHDFIYPINYGYVPNTVSPDGEELDAYILNVVEPLEAFTGRCVAVIHRTDDNDDKLVIVSDGQTVTDEEIRQQTYFQEQFFKSEIVRIK